MVDTPCIACHYTIALNENGVSLNETRPGEGSETQDGETSCILLPGAKRRAPAVAALNRDLAEIAGVGYEQSDVFSRSQWSA
jgi:hypothetical protein